MQDSKFNNLLKFLDSSENFVISGHENPDPDSLCSCVAMEYLLSSLDKNVFCINSEEAPVNLDQFDYRGIINSLEKGAKIPDNIKDYSMIVLDSIHTDNVGKLEDQIFSKVKNIFFIDHHSVNEEVNSYNSYVVVTASSTCEIIYGLYDHFKLKMPKEVGDAIYAAILFDSGSFHHPKTSSYTFQIASKIIENGTDPNQIYLDLFEKKSVESVKILSFVLPTLELDYNDQIAVLTMTKEMLDKTGADYEECSEIINVPLKAGNIKAVVFCKENNEGVKRISLRSKGDINVDKLAFLWNGGGHKNASGFKLGNKAKEFNEVIPKVLDYLRKEIDRK